MSGLFRQGNQPVINVLGGIRVQTSLQGVPIQIVYGRTRISGNLVWYGGFVADVVSGNGKKGGQAAFAPGGSGKKGAGEYDYGAALVIGLCQGPISGIGAIWSTQGNLPVNETQETYTVPGPGGAYEVTQADTYLSDLGVTRGDPYSVVANDYGAPSSITLTGTAQTPMTPVSGSPGAGQYERTGLNDATYNFSSADAGKVVTITYTYAPPLNSGGTAQDPITTVGFTLFNGALGQSVWSYLTSEYPTQAIGYSGLAYVATPLFDLGMSGVLPNLNFEVYGLLPFGGGAGDCNPSDVLYDLLTNSLYGCGIETAQVGSMTQYSNYCIANGLFISPVIDTARTAADWIRDILDATNSEIIETGGQIVVVPYGDTTVVGNGATFQPQTDPVYDLDEDDFIRTGSMPAVQVTRPNIKDAYNCVTIEYVDRNNSYNPSIVQAQDLQAIDAYKYRPEGSRQYHMFTEQVPAALAAATILSRLVYIRNQYKFKIPQKYILLDPMDLVTLTVPELGLDESPVRILTIDENEDRTLDITAEEFPWGCSGPTLYPKQGNTPGGPNAYAPPGSINPPIIFEALSQLNNQIGHSIWFGTSGANPNWGGCRIWVSIDGEGGPYVQIATAIGVTQMGSLTANFPSNPDPDTTDTLAVDLTESEGELASVTALDCNAFASLCYVGPNATLPPVAPTLASVASAPADVGTKYVVVTYVTGTGETSASPEASKLIGPSSILKVDSPVASPGATGWNVYVATSSGAEELQNATPIAIGTAWTEPSSGLISGVTPPAASVGELISYQNATLTSAYKYDLATLIRRGVYGSEIGAHPEGSAFMYLNNAVEGWDYDTGLIGSTIYFKFTSFNQSGLIEENIADVSAYPYTVTGACIGLLTPAHASYRPSSNPLTAIDAGASATIYIASFDMIVPGLPNVVLNSGAITGLAYNTLYYVYFYDPTFESIAPTYLVSTTKTDAIDSAGNMFVGSILTPISGGTETVGNNDGGGGAQIGMENILETSVYSTSNIIGNGAIANPQYAVDGNTTTFAALTLSGNNSEATLELSGPPGISRSYYNASLEIDLAVPTNSLLPTTPPEPVVAVGVSTDGGNSYHALATYLQGNVVARQTLSYALPLNINLSQVMVLVTISTVGSTTITSGSLELDVYSAYIKANE